MKGRYGSPLSGYGKTTAWRKVCGKWAYSRTIFSAILVSLPDQKNTSGQLHSFSRTGARSVSPLPCAALGRLSIYLSWKHTGVLFLAALSTRQYSLKF